MGFFFSAFAFLGTAVAASLFLYCFGLGLLSLCEKAENSPNYLKKGVLKISYVIAVCHVLFLSLERISIWRLILSGAALFVHYRLVLDLPSLEMNSALANGAILLINHFMWFSYFIRSGHSVLEVISFYLFMVWAVPVAIVISYSSSELLPGLYDHKPSSHRGAQKRYFFLDDTSLYLEDEGMNPVDLVNPHRPEDSYCRLIRRALVASPRQRLFLHEIYDYLYTHYSYFRHSGSGWKNSVRHALSTGKEFLRIKESRKCATRGSGWCLRDSPMGQWYLSLNDCKLMDDTSGAELGREGLEQLLEFTSLIPSIFESMSEVPGQKNTIDLANYPQHLLGLVPNPDFYACPKITSPPFGAVLHDYSDILHSPKSHPSTPMRKN